MKQRELVLALLHKASQDEAVMSRLLPDADIDDEVIGFHAQQAVEKSLKAWLTHKGVRMPALTIPPRGGESEEKTCLPTD